MAAKRVFATASQHKKSTRKASSAILPSDSPDITRPRDAVNSSCVGGWYMAKAPSNEAPSPPQQMKAIRHRSSRARMADPAAVPSPRTPPASCQMDRPLGHLQTAVETSLRSLELTRPKLLHGQVLAPARGIPAVKPNLRLHAG